MDDLTLLSLVVKDKGMHTRITPFIKEHSVSEYSWDILKGVSDYYKAYPTQLSVNMDEFRSFFFLIKGKVKPEKASLYSRVIDNIISKVAEGADLTATAKDVLSFYVEQDYATRVANVSFKLASGDKSAGDIDTIDSLCKEYKKEVGRAVSKEDIFVSTKLSELVASVFTDGLNWRLEEMNISLGPLRQGDFIILGARPETGKTTFLASELTHFAKQLKKDAGPIIWVNNEERDDKVMFRIIQSYFGITTEVLKKDLASYERKYDDEMGGRIVVVRRDSGCNTVWALDRLFTEFNPSLIVIDQLDKVVGFQKESRDDLRLGRLYAWARDKAIEYGPVMAASQVSGGGEGSQWITQAQLRGSTTDKAGEADAIITIGAVNDPAKPNDRFIHVAKNKLAGGPKTQESFRHGYFNVLIQPDIARYKGTMK